MLDGVGERIRQARLEAGMSQARLSELIGTNANGANVCQWETGCRQPDLRSILRLANALGIDAAELLGL